MTNLKGTEKQVAWAEDIRAGQIRQMEKYIRDWELRIEREGIYPGYTWILEKHKEALEELRQVSEAKFWIEHRRIANALNTRIIRASEGK